MLVRAPASGVGAAGGEELGVEKWLDRIEEGRDRRGLAIRAEVDLGLERGVEPGERGGRRSGWQGGGVGGAVVGAGRLKMNLR